MRPQPNQIANSLLPNGQITIRIHRVTEGDPSIDDSEDAPGNTIDFSKVPELVGKAILGFGAAAYAAGFLISNISLGSYGAGTVELVRSDYILVGSTFILLCGTASLYCAEIWRGMVAPARVSRRIKALQLSTIFIGYFVIIWAMTGILSAFRERPVRETLAGVVPIVISPLFIWLPYVFYREAWKRWPLSTAAVRATTVGFTITAYCISLLLFLGVYSRLTYPLLDRTYGGGRPIRVRVVLDDSANAALLKTLATVLDRQSGSCELVAETSDWILIRKGAGVTLTESRPLRISRSAVRAILPAADH
jgi:hypothetical protein